LSVGGGEEIERTPFSLGGYRKIERKIDERE
jgi:hypothetical protein